MSNEELVAAIQAGAEERMGELWEQVCGLVKWKANHVMNAMEGFPGCGVEFDDLYQSGYPAMVAAVESYDPTAGAFSTWFMYHLKTAFAEATGYRTKRGQNEPLNNSFSLDKTVDDESDGTPFGEFVPDPKAAATMLNIEEKLWREQLHEALDAALAALPEQSAEVLRLRHYHGLTYAAVGEIQKTTPERIRQMEFKAIRELRRPRYACHLRPFYEFDFYCGTSLGAFQHTGMSIQERYLVIEENRKERENERRKQEEEKLMQQLEESRRWLAEQEVQWRRRREELMQDLSSDGQEKLRRMLTGRDLT